MKKRWKLLLILLALCIGTYFYLQVRKSNDFEPQIKAKLGQLISTATNGLFLLDIEKIEIDIISSSISVKNIVLRPDSARMQELEKANLLGNDIYRIALKKLDITGFSPLDLLDNKNIKLDKLVLDSPEITITRTLRNKISKDSNNLYDKIAALKQTYSIGNLLLNNIKLTIISTGKNKTISAFKNLSASFTEIQIDSSTINDSSRFLFAKDAVVTIKGFSQITPKRKYIFSIDSVSLQPQYGTLKFYNLRFMPGKSKEEFIRQLIYGEDMYDVHVKSGTIKNINWFSILADEGIYSDEVTVNDGKLYVYKDKSLRSGTPKYKNFPHQKLMNAGFPISVKKTIIKSLDVSYEEFNPASELSGTVEFKNVSLVVDNLTNIPAEIKIHPVTSAKASALFMNEGKLDAVFKFDMTNTDKGNFSVKATLGPMDGMKLNQITEGLAMVKLKSLAIDQLNLNITGSNNYGKGNVLLAYHDLSFDVLKKDEDNGGLKKKGLLSFIANTFIIKKSNPTKAGAVPRQYTVMYDHDPKRSFFNLIWKTLFQGILKTAK